MFNNLNLMGNEYTRMFHRALKRTGITHATGVPCGELRHFIHAFDADPQIAHFPALNEREAVGIAAGMWLAGKFPVLHMQNSGLFVASNDIASILLPCRMDIPMIISFRGCPGETTPQHYYTGLHTRQLLQGLAMFQVDLRESNAEEAPEQAVSYSRKNEVPSAILVRRGWTKVESVSSASSDRRTRPLAKKPGDFADLQAGKALPSREEVLSAIWEATPQNAALISSTGLISRSLFERHDSPNQFYNAGGFGVTSAIGLGLGVTQPDVPVVVVEGDASCLTNLGNLVSIAHWAPKNLVHIVVDNEAFGSCSEEPSLSPIAHLFQSAHLWGYRQAVVVDSLEVLSYFLKEALTQEGPIFVQVKIGLGGRRDFARPVEMYQIARRFREHLFQMRP